MNRYFRMAAAGAIMATAAMTAKAQQVQGFVHQQSDASGYEWPTDTAVMNKLDQWRDLKFGVLFHWEIGRAHV